MEQEVTILLRKLANSGPRWARYAFVTATFIGAFLKIIVASYPDVLGRFMTIPWWGWEIIGIVIAFPPAFVWQSLKGLIGVQPSNRERSEEYIYIIKLDLEQAELSTTDQRFFWRSVMSKLMGSFNVGATPPSPVTIIEEVRKVD